MHWNSYGECRGRPACSEVLIRCDPGDQDHPWVLKRKSMYEKLGKRVVVVTAPSDDDRPSRPRRSGPANAKEAGL